MPILTEPERQTEAPSGMPFPAVLALLGAVLCSLLASLALFAAAWWWKPHAALTFYAIAMIVTNALLLATARQVLASTPLPCMAGMMIGMTLGMMASFLTGYYLGATNGLFTGSVCGMAAGTALGAWLGSRFGVMGFMEGAMAAFMSGPMGAMTAVMLLDSRVQAMGLVFLALGAVILAALNQMVFIEQRGAGRPLRGGVPATILISIALTAATLAVMIFGPGSRIPLCHRS